MGGFSQHTDEETTGDELSIIDNSSSTEDDERSDSDVSVIRSLDEDVQERIDGELCP